MSPVDAEVVVRGRGEARALPDRALVRAEVDGEANTRDDAYREVARLATTVDEVVARHAAAIDRNTTAALVVHPKTRWRRGESVRTGWRGSRTTVLEVVDFAHLGDLFAELAAAGGAVGGPYWQLDPANPVHSDARRLAAEDARRRAETYASALGLRVTGIAWVAEPGLRDRGIEPQQFALAAKSARFEAAAEEIIDVAPDEMTIDAAVDVAFTFAPSE